MAKKERIAGVKYHFDSQGAFVIENYNESKPFSNFFPGVAGLWGIPMWAFYVNRGQCIASFGIESKDKAIMEFLPANKAYRHAALNGFRTFIKVKSGKTEKYWEPFQNNLKGTDYKKKVRMAVTAHDLTLEEENIDLGLTVTVNYFTLPEEPFAALVRKVSIINKRKKKYTLELLDGLPNINPYGLKDWLSKNMSRTVEAWVKVKNLEHKAPFYQLNVEVSDTPQVTHIKEGNFCFSLNLTNNSGKLLDPIVEASKIFAESYDFTAPVNFISGNMDSQHAHQKTSNKSPSAMTYLKEALKPSGRVEFVSLFGYAVSQEQLNEMVHRVRSEGFIERKSRRNEEIISGIKDNAFTLSSSQAFNLYAGHTFLDNILRGGLPVSVKTGDGRVAFNVYSRKHGDLERDYNFFFVSPTFFSQGNGNYRDVNQNRRNDVWFNTDVKDDHIVSFLNLCQADGYNPLIVKGTSFKVKDENSLKKVLNNCVKPSDHAKVAEFVAEGFLPGELLKHITKMGISLKTDIKDFLGQIIEVCSKQELAEHGEGFWTDHWHYNLDLVESYLNLYPENLRTLLLDKKDFFFFHNDHYVLPRNRRYVLTAQGVRQYASVHNGKNEIPVKETGHRLRTLNGKGVVYHTTLLCKLLCLIVNKMASLDPSNIGVEMEADKPNWYDALNGLPGLLGSSISETLEIKRFSQFLLASINDLHLRDDEKIFIFEELASFISGLSHVLSSEKDHYTYWVKSNDIKEHYRLSIRYGIKGEEKALSVKEVRNFLSSVLVKIKHSVDAAQTKEGFLSTYFYHDVTADKVLDKPEHLGPCHVMPKQFKKHHLPLFLEGYVHALRGETSVLKAKKLYEQVRKSGLFDKKLKMYRVNDDLSGQTEEIGRTRIFPKSWLENGSIWLHMEYKFLLELLRCELYEEFYENFKNALIPFLDPKMYGRSILENSSFIVSSTHEDTNLHGQGFVARLSGSTAEFLHIWLYMNAGRKPFSLNAKGELVLVFQPVLAGWLFTDKKQEAVYINSSGIRERISFPANTYAFNFLGSTLVVYHNPKRVDTFGGKKPNVSKIELTYEGQKKPITISSGVITGFYAQDIRNHRVKRIDVYFGHK